jgi:hypothetical protein
VGWEYEPQCADCERVFKQGERRYVVGVYKDNTRRTICGSCFVGKNGVAHTAPPSINTEIVPITIHSTHSIQRNRLIELIKTTQIGTDIAIAAYVSCPSFHLTQPSSEKMADAILADGWMRMD